MQNQSCQVIGWQWWTRSATVAPVSNAVHNIETRTVPIAKETRAMHSHRFLWLNLITF